MRRGAAGLVVPLLAALVLAACSGASSSPRERTTRHPVVASGSSASVPPPVRVACPSAARAVLQRVDRGVGVRVSADVVTGLSTCRYRAVPPSGTPTSRVVCPSAELTVDTAAQAFVDFNRWVDEQGQNSQIPGQSGLSPQQIDAPRLGIEVDWVPGHQTLETGRPGRWISVFLHCRDAGAHPLAIARHLAATAVAP